MRHQLHTKTHDFDVFEELSDKTNISREKWEEWYTLSSRQAPSAQLMEAAALAYPTVGSFLFGVDNPLATHVQNTVIHNLPPSPGPKYFLTTNECTDQQMRSYFQLHLDLQRNLWHNNTWTEAEKIFMDAYSLTREQATEKIVSIMMETYILSKQLLHEDQNGNLGKKYGASDGN